MSGSTTDLNNCTLVIAGWSDSRNAPILAGPTIRGSPGRMPAAPAMDSCWISAAAGFTTPATWAVPEPIGLHYIGPGSASGSIESYAIAGETDNPAWDGATVQRIGSGGQMDAVIGVVAGRELSLLAIGGSGDDRALGLRAATDGSFFAAGETASTDFPSTTGPHADSGTDAWTGRLWPDGTAAPLLRLFGGDGDDRVGGIAYIAD